MPLYTEGTQNCGLNIYKQQRLNWRNMLKRFQQIRICFVTRSANNTELVRFAGTHHLIADQVPP